MNRTIGLLLITLFLAISSTAQVKLQDSLILSGEQDSVSSVKATPNISQDVLDDNAQVAPISIDYKYNTILSKPVNSRSFYDIDARISFKTIQYSIFPRIINHLHKRPIAIPKPIGYKNLDLSTSIDLIYHYQIYKGLYVGAGIAPTYYHYISPKATNKFDVPIVVKAGYNFQPVDLSFSYKFGTVNVLKDEHFKSGRMNDLQMQLFVPF